MSKLKQRYSSTTRIMVLTLVTMVVLAVFIAVSFYKTQLKLFQDKELHKLDCIANAVSYKIDGAAYKVLLEKYPTAAFADSVSIDPDYQKIRMQMDMARIMNKIEDDWHTVAYDSTQNNYQFGVNIGDTTLWGQSYINHPPMFLEKYFEGGSSGGPYDDETGTWLSAFSPITGPEGEVVGVLQVDERFDSFIGEARDQIFFNLGVMLCVIALIGTLMFLSVKNILKRQEKLNVSRLEIEQLRQELIANVSHDLRTPLASIHGYIETLLMKKDTLDPERFEKYLNTTLRSTEKLRKLVDELFELSKLESHERKLNTEPLAIDDLIQDVVREFQIDASEKGITMTVKTPEQLPQVNADIALIDRVLQNLIQNSIKFCNEGDTITVSAGKSRGMVNISVTDSGEGISEEDLPHIFDRFHKGQPNKKGSGLGLAIVKNILELHQSKYSVGSQLSTGTSFTFELPISPPTRSES